MPVACEPSKKQKFFDFFRITERLMAGISDQTQAKKWWLVGLLGKSLVNLIGGTIRIQIIDFQKAKVDVESRKFILAFWHSRILLVSYLYKEWGGVALVSSSNDGEITARILERQGHETIRGSTSRYAVRALARLIRALKKEVRPGAVVPDGPRGPRFRVQPGVITLAQKTGYPIVPITYSAKRQKVFASWDRFILPCPFTEATVIYGEPVRVPAEVDAQQREWYRVKLEEEMNRITRKVDNLYGYQIE